MAWGGGVFRVAGVGVGKAFVEWRGVRCGGAGIACSGCSGARGVVHMAVGGGVICWSACPRLCPRWGVRPLSENRTSAACCAPPPPHVDASAGARLECGNRSRTRWCCAGGPALAAAHGGRPGRARVRVFCACFFAVSVHSCSTGGDIRSRRCPGNGGRGERRKNGKEAKPEKGMMVCSPRVKDRGSAA